MIFWDDCDSRWVTLTMYGLKWFSNNSVVSLSLESGGILSINMIWFHFMINAKKREEQTHKQQLHSHNQTSNKQSFEMCVWWWNLHQHQHPSHWFVVEGEPFLLPLRPKDRCRYSGMIILHRFGYSDKKRFLEKGSGVNIKPNQFWILVHMGLEF